MIEFLKQTFGDAVTEDVISKFKGELGRKFVAKADYNTKRDELKGARAQLEELQQQAAALQAQVTDAGRLKEDMDALQKKYDEHVSVLNGRLEQVKLEGEIAGLIRRKGGRNEKAVRALLDIGDESPMENAAQQLDLLKKSDPYLFDCPSPGGAKGNFPRNSAVPKGSLTYSQMMQLRENS